MTPYSQTTEWTPSRKVALGGILLIWFAATYATGSSHLLTNDQQSLIGPIGATVVLPVALFLGFYALSTGFRRFVLSQDIRTLTMLQHWRVIGFTFLPLYAFGVLPGLFAWPAGLGDVAVGITAFFVIRRLDRDANYATSAGFVGFNLLGLTDFIVAIITSGLAAGAYPALIANGATSAPMDVWPLNLFPSFIVPAFIILHLSVLLKVRHLRQAARHPVGGSLRTI
ncbi:MAG: hypothetical protein OEU46_07490 [Alphaproteobacteria bacterium]|nr:hypothetical protein [Alphaproteobacteria bacterium]